MPLQYIFKPTFEKAFEKLPDQKRALTIKALEALDQYFKTGQAAFGLRVKKLYDLPSGKTFETRVSLDLRIVWVQSKEKIVFALLGNHDEIRRFIKNL